MASADDPTGDAASALAALIDACTQGDVAAVREVLDAAQRDAADADAGAAALKALVDARGDDGAAPLHAALRAENVDCAIELVKYGCDVNALDEMAGLLPVHLLARLGPHVFDDADDDAGDEAKDDAAASADGARSSTGAVSGAGASDGGAAGGDGDADADADADADGDGSSGGACASLLRAMLEAGADIDVPDASGNGPLAYAGQFGTPEMVSLLVSLGADMNATDEDGDTPLHCASFTGNSAAVDALLEAGADDTLADNAGITPAAMRAARVKQLPRLEADAWALEDAAEYHATATATSGGDGDGGAAGGAASVRAPPSADRLAALVPGSVALLYALVRVALPPEAAEDSGAPFALVAAEVHAQVDEVVDDFFKGTLLDIPDLGMGLGVQPGQFFVGKEVWFQQAHVGDVTTADEAEAAADASAAGDA